MIRTKSGWVGGSNFKSWLSDVRTDQAVIVRAGIEAAAEGLRDDLRQDIEQAGLGERLGNAIGANVYPRSEKGSLDAAGYVFPRGRKANAIFQSFNEASVITAQRGKYLAIPTPDAGVRHTSRSFANKPISPAIWQQETGIKLRFVKRGNIALLVADARYARQPARYRRRASFAPIKTRLPGDRRTIVIFILIPVAHMTRRLRFEAKADLWAGRIPELIDAAGKGVRDG